MDVQQNKKMNEKEKREKIEIALAEIRPFLVADGGDVELIDFTEDKVNVKFVGACKSCTINKMTLKSGIEATIKKHVPHINEVVAVV